MTIYWEGDEYTTSERVHRVPCPVSTARQLSQLFAIGDVIENGSVGSVGSVSTRVPREEELWAHLQRATKALIPCVPYAVIVDGIAGELIWRILGAEVKRYEGELISAGTCAESDGYSVVFTGEGAESLFRVGYTAQVAKWTRRLDVRAPFTDPALVEYADSISPAFKLDGTRPMGLLWGMHQ